MSRSDRSSPTTSTEHPRSVRAALHPRTAVAILALSAIATISGALSSRAHRSTFVVPVAHADQDPAEREPSSTDDDADDLSRAPRSSVDAFLRAKKAEAERHFAAGRYQAAKRIADAILILDPDVPYREELRRLRIRAEARFLGRTILSPYFESRPVTVYPRVKLEGRIWLESLSQQPIRLDIGEDEILGRCRYQIYEIYDDGSHWTSSGANVVRAVGAITIEPGERRSLPVSIEIVPGLREPVLQYVRLEGEVRPERIIHGGNLVDRGIAWEPFEDIAVPAELADVRDDPETSLDRALAAGDFARIAAAGFLWIYEINGLDELGAEERERAITRLLAALETSELPALDSLLMRLLESVSEERIPLIRERWLEWGEKRARDRRTRG